MFKTWLNWGLKLGLTILAIYLVSQKIDWNEVKDVFFQSKWIYLFPAFLLYVLSKVISAFRLNMLQHQIPIPIDNKQNLKLYFIGMFYNLFLPGGIGGDGYKAYWLKKNYNAEMKPILSALFLDRFFGLAALFILLFSSLFFTNIFQTVSPSFQWVNIILLVLVIPVTYLIVFFFFKTFIQPFWKVIGLSLLSQGTQIIEALCILKSLQVTELLFNYISLFLASSVAAVLPISIGGVGVRELVFIYGHDLLSIKENQAVAFSLMFFLISALSSLMGAFLHMKKVID